MLQSTELYTLKNKWTVTCRHHANRTCSVEYCAKNCAVNVIEGALFRMKVELFPGVPQCVNSGPSSYMFTGRLQVVGSECPGRGARPRIKTFDLKIRPRRFLCLYKSLFWDLQHVLKSAWSYFEIKSFYKCLLFNFHTSLCWPPLAVLGWPPKPAHSTRLEKVVTGCTLK